MRKSILSVLALATGFLCLASCTPENGVNPDLQGEADVMFVGNIVTIRVRVTGTGSCDPIFGSINA